MVLALELLSSRRKMQTLSRFHAAASSSDRALKELNNLIDRCFCAQNHNTRLQTRGMPTAVLTTSRMVFNSFIIRTGREMRVL